MNAADAIHNDTETADDVSFLLGAGSPLGGARLKSAVRLEDDRLALAKFPKPDDARDIGAGEALAMKLAAKAGIRVAEHRFITVAGHHVLVSVRFDRVQGRRIPFISGSTLLALPQDQPGSYVTLADGTRQFGDDVKGDLRELWMRMVYSLLASNYDDHLRNHGFLMNRPGRWSLAPAYDLNPVPEIERGHTNKTAITEGSAEVSISRALAVAAHFGLNAVEARQILREVFRAVSDWRTLGKALRFKAATLNAYESAFQNPLMEEARHLIEN